MPNPPVKGSAGNALSSRVKRWQRVVVSKVGGGVPNLATSTATRTLFANGYFLEYVKLDGSAKLMDQTKLDEWLDGFPIKEPKK